MSEPKSESSLMETARRRGPAAEATGKLKRHYIVQVLQAVGELDSGRGEPAQASATGTICQIL